MAAALLPPLEEEGQERLRGLPWEGIPTEKRCITVPARGWGALRGRQSQDCFGWKGLLSSWSPSIALALPGQRCPASHRSPTLFSSAPSVGGAASPALGSAVQTGQDDLCPKRLRVPRRAAGAAGRAVAGRAGAGVGSGARISGSRLHRLAAPAARGGGEGGSVVPAMSPSDSS